MKSSVAPKIKAWRDNPCQFVFDNFGVVPDKWQEEVLTVFPSQDIDKMRVSLQACAGPGKSAVLTWCGWNFLSCYGEKGEHPKGAAVSVTADNLKDNLWPEFSKWQERSPYLRNTFQWTKERIFAKDHPETWFMSARSWSKTANADEQGRTLSGLHSKYVLVLIDESGEIPISVLKAGEQALSNCTWGKIMQAGNPTSLDGMLYAAATTLRAQWYIVRITGDPDDPNRSPRIGMEYARNQIALYGRENPWVQSYILGIFPPSSINTLFGPDDVEKAMNRPMGDESWKFAQKRIGIDVARFGDDRTVLFKRQGLWTDMPIIMRGERTNNIAARVMKEKAEWGSELEFVDDTGGYGGGVVDSMIMSGTTPIAVNASGKADDARYYNKRAEMWFRMSEWVKRGGSLPKLPELTKELTSPTYTFKDGRFLLESKDQIKARLKFSPDLADALAQTFAIVDMPGMSGVSVPGMPESRGKLLHEFDPFENM